MTVLAIAGNETPLDQRFQYTGSLLETSVYLPRPADDELEGLLFDGAYCNIIAPRQIGKTSLRVRVASRLEARGRRCVALDLTKLGTVRKDEEWYFGFIYAIAKSLGQPSPWAFWKERVGVPFALRWADYLLTLVEQFPEGLVIFVDEIEAVLLSDWGTAIESTGAAAGAEAHFSRDDFFTAIRALFEGRNQDERCRRLTFCLVGVTTPSDLVVNKKVTPFNISRPIRLHDFTRAEIDGLATPLATLGANTQALLDAIFSWTDGHPYMTMRICASLAQLGAVLTGQERRSVDEIVQRDFLDHALQDPNLNYAARRFDDTRFESGGVTLTDKILLYDRVLSNSFVEDQVEDQVQLELRLAGMIKAVRTDQGRGLRVRNQIYARALDRDWLASKGDRREIATGVWGWTKADRDPEYLFRGAKLREALARARSGVPLSAIEREFLTESQRVETEGLQKAEATAREAAAEKQRETEELSKITEALSKETEELSKKETRLRRLVRTLSWSIALMLTVGAVAYAVLTQQQVKQLRAADAAQKLAQQARTDTEATKAAAAAAVEQAKNAQKSAKSATEQMQLATEQTRQAFDAADAARRQAASAVADANREVQRQKALVAKYAETIEHYSQATAVVIEEEYRSQISTLTQKNEGLDRDLKAAKAQLGVCERTTPSNPDSSAAPPSRVGSPQ